MVNTIEPDVKKITEKDPYKKIELISRTCYKSEDKITKTSAKKFVKSLIKRMHTAMLEHQYFLFQIKNSGYFVEQYINMLKNEDYVHVTKHTDYISENGMIGSNIRYLVSANVRTICERGINDPIFRAIKNLYPELIYNENDKEVYNDVYALVVNLTDFDDITEEEILEHSYFTFRVICDRGVSHEFVRHRPCSFAQESTRYVNYKEGIAVIPTNGFDEKSEEVRDVYMEAFNTSDDCYRKLIELGESSQQARAVLPTALKTELVVTANMNEWKHIMNLRYFGITGTPHPDMKVIAEKIYNILKKDKMVGGLIG